jgi:hypothetical protein
MKRARAQYDEFSKIYNAADLAGFNKARSMSRMD